MGVVDTGEEKASDSTRITKSALVGLHTGGWANTPRPLEPQRVKAVPYYLHNCPHKLFSVIFLNEGLSSYYII